MVVEVETAAGFESGQRGHTLEQLEKYRLSGYTLVLAVPESDLDAAHEFVDEHDVRDSLETVTASNIASILE